MRVLILGATGMLGHKLVQRLSSTCDVYATVRREFDFSSVLRDWTPRGVLSGVAVESPASVEGAIQAVRPDSVVNCIAVRRGDCMAVNGLFPLYLAAFCKEAGARLIHISSDGVFSGTRGSYTEADASDARDFYGRVKAAGEIHGPNCLTLRTSIIGREIREPKMGVVEWLLSQGGGTCKGYSRAVFSGVTTCALSEIIRRLLADHRDLSGVYHVAGRPISKLDLLEALRERFALPVTIEPDDEVCYDRSLDGSAFERRTGLRPPDWPAMIDELYGDSRNSYRNAQNC